MHKISLKYQSKNQVKSNDLESVLDASGLLNQQIKVSPENKKIESKRGRQVISQRTNSLLGVQIVSSGSYVPDNVVTNQDLQERFGFDPEWIEQRTGILERRHAPADMATSDLCYEAAQKAIRAARVNPEDIDLLIVGTFTPDFQCPSVACLVQDRLGLDAPAIDLQAACAGFMYALVTAAQYVATGNSKLALVIGGDCNSRIVNPEDRRVAPLFGDGAGAVLLAKGDPHQGLACYQTGSDGSGCSLLDRPAGGTRNPATAEDIQEGRHFLNMDGRSVFKWAVRTVADSIDLMLTKTGMSVHDVDLFLMHQANIRIIDSACEQLGIPKDKVFNNLDRYGNTSGGSIPIVLDEAFNAGLINRGDTVLLSGFGAGLAWGTGLFRW
ncbi:3-oxoacyl-[acyl-carrier-protein] synthase 3 [Gimesia alba]|uniref:Beta-ketoacyl-[acyl-carrier-protein] synthase III n=1 Tax=Gimesia alba TaxID=2527973 RepID=A0A517RDT0_9PLAN|nr:beta-ketoacyl-ACP synthase III [Gimesia alba]QDT42038.1 3-oxoacyl-[acyl-carrier-protein] synthase 3 [Gimesia alba]